MDTTELHEHVFRVYARLMRHRERYVRAWLAATGYDPRECVLVERQEYDERGRITTTIEARRREP